MIRYLIWTYKLTRERDSCSLTVMPYPNVNGFALLNDHARRSNWSGFGNVYATTDEYIAPGQEYTVWSKVHCPGLRPGETYTGVVEVTERLPASYGLVGCCTLAIGGSSQHVPFKVFNLSGETVRMHKNQSLAEFTEATTSTSTSTGLPDVVKITPGNHITDKQSKRQHLLYKYQTMFAYDRNE